MRIGIDIKVFRHNRAGIGRYLRSILNVLQIVDIENDYVLFSPAPVHFEIRNPRWKKVIEKGNIPGPGIIWQQFTLADLAKKENIEVMWGPEQTIFHNKPKGMATVLTVHDFVNHRFPETMKKSVLWVNRLFLKRSLETADRIFCVSGNRRSYFLRFIFHFPRTPEFLPRNSGRTGARDAARFFWKTERL